jgi:hypothetical protein
VIAGLDKTVSDSKAAAEQAKAAVRDLVRLRQDLESDRAKHGATLERERAEHESAMARERAEVEAALELKAKAESDAAAARSPLGFASHAAQKSVTVVPLRSASCNIPQARGG